MNEERGAGPLAETEPELEVRLEPEMRERDRVSGLRRPVRGEERVVRRRRERGRDERGAGGDEAVHGHRHPARRAREDHADEAGDLESTEGGEHCETIRGVRVIDRQRETDHADFPAPRGVVDAGAAPGDALDVGAGQCGRDRAGGRRVADAHLADRKEIRARLGGFFGERDPGLDRGDRLLS